MNATAAICVTCGAQFPPAERAPATCPICLDERQYVGHDGQQWTDPATLAQSHHNRIEQLAPGLYGIGTEPSFAIGQRALLIQTAGHNVLWDCISLLDEPTVDAVNALGGIDVIAISHPHFHTAMIDWAQAFEARILVHGADRDWVQRPGPAIEYWSGDTLALNQDITLINAGGHFAGATALHWVNARGNLLATGDTVKVCADRDWVSFMYSYPNDIPLPAGEVARIAAMLEPWLFERLYGGWWSHVVKDAADAKLQRSARRYQDALAGIFRPGQSGQSGQSGQLGHD